MDSKPLDLPETLWELVEARAAATPDAVFMENDAGRSLTFAGYRDGSARVAAGLLGAGIGRGATVAWQLPTTIDAAVLMAALSRLGATQVPIIPILRAREVTYIGRESKCDWMLVPGEWRGFDYRALADGIAAEVGFEVLTVDPPPEADPATLPPPLTGEEAREPRWLYYTSGSTADPKGVRHRDATVMAGSNGLVRGLQPTADDLFPFVVPFTHIAGMTMGTTCLRTGMRLLVLDTFDPQRTLPLTAERGATIIGPALPLFQAFIGAQRAHGPERLWPRMRVGISGGAPKPLGLHQELKEVVGGAGIMGSWGLTEFPHATCGLLDDGDDDLDRTEGVAAPGVEIRVVGLDGEEKGPNEEGELRLRGPQMFLGYANTALDADAFDEKGFFRTGDLGCVSETGYVTITGRVKDIIIRNAENISAAEVEECLHLHPAIADVAVIGLPDPRTGERACAVVSLAEGHDALTLADIAAHSREQGLAAQKTPEQLEIVDQVPRSAMGKIDKPALRARYADQAAASPSRR
ncbi:MAG TPA: AMP-binding protein [Acidimicrobiales bacterium]|nr:AMP-binding protein [Acidimicrobiales bacterium]